MYERYRNGSYETQVRWFFYFMSYYYFSFSTLDPTLRASTANARLGIKLVIQSTEVSTAAWYARKLEDCRKQLSEVPSVRHVLPAERWVVFCNDRNVFLVYAYTQKEEREQKEVFEKYYGFHSE